MIDHKKITPNISKYDVGFNLANFLLDKTGSIFGIWNDHMLKKDQLNLFGMYLGKGNIYINGATERISHTVSRCFGTDFETTFSKMWNELDKVEED